MLTRAIPVLLSTMLISTAAVAGVEQSPAYVAVGEKQRACMRSAWNADERQECLLRAKTERQQLRAQYYRENPAKAAAMRDVRAQRRAEITRVREARAAYRATIERSDEIAPGT